MTESDREKVIPIQYISKCNMSYITCDHCSVVSGVRYMQYFFRDDLWHVAWMTLKCHSRSLQITPSYMSNY